MPPCRGTWRHAGSRSGAGKDSPGQQNTYWSPLIKSLALQIVLLAQLWHAMPVPCVDILMILIRLRVIQRAIFPFFFVSEKYEIMQVQTAWLMTERGKKNVSRAQETTLISGEIFAH